MEEGKEINRAVVESLEHGQWAGLPGIHPTTCRISVGLESTLEGKGAERESAENLYGKGVCDGCLFNKVHGSNLSAREDKGRPEGAFWSLKTDRKSVV